jgi:prolyl 4-hydroxylase
MAANQIGELNRRAAAGDASALFELGALSLAGQAVPRDLAVAREMFRRAAVAGRKDAAVIYTNFVASGVGAAADWARGLALLRDLSRVNPRSAREIEVIGAMDLGPDGQPEGHWRRERLSERPQVELARGFFSPLECDYVTAAAEPMLEPSVVVDPATGRQIPNPGRTSDGMGFTWPLENPAIHALNRRIARLTETDAAQGEPLQVLRYRGGQQYRPHFDAIPGFGNQRILTVLVYLNEGYEDGETWFETPQLKVKGRRGDALVFRNVDDEGRPDKDAGHAGLPVTRGTKLICSRWIRAAAFSPS